jgi:predicted S18 family serine protease
MLDIDKLEEISQEISQSGNTLTISSGWLKAVIREVRGNRARIAELEAQVASKKPESDPELHKEVQEGFERASSFFNQGWERFDRGFDAMSGIFRGKKKS